MDFLKHHDKSASQTPRRNKIKIFAALLMLLVVAGSIGSSFFFFRQVEKIKKDPNIVVQEEVRFLVDHVGKLMLLPNDETPTVATVLDKDRLKDQQFFNNAQNGDKLLIYTTNKIAIIYRQSENRIVNVGPIVLNENQSQQTSAEQKPKEEGAAQSINGARGEQIQKPDQQSE